MSTISLTKATIISGIKRHLSIIGKRLYSKDGKNMFSDITLSSAEDTQILTQYIESSVHDVEAVLKPLISTVTIDTTTITGTITNTRGDSDFQQRTNNMMQTYITLNTTGEYLSMVHPDIAQKYSRDAQQSLEALVGYVFYKNPFLEGTAQQARPSATVGPYSPPAPSDTTPEPGTPDPDPSD